MRPVLMTALACALVAAAQDKPKRQPTAEQIIEKSIEASGGRKAMEELTSTVAKGTLDIAAPADDHDHAAELVPHPEPPKMRSTIEFYAKAPNKRLIVTNIEGFGEIRQGFDGSVAWNQTPQGVSEVTGEALESIRREAVFNSALRWRELFQKAELKGKEKVAGREAYVILLTPASGKPVTQYCDAETFLLVGQSGTVETAQGPIDIRTEMSDYRDIGNGVKAPFKLKQMMPVGQVLITMSEMRNNVEIDDAIFSKPAN
jgi:hypothetical protein